MIDSSAAPEPERGVAHRVRRAELLADLHHALSGAVQDDESLLHVVAERVATLTGQGCSVRLLGEDGRTLGEAAFHHPDAATRDAMRGLLAPVQRPELSLASSLVGHAPRTYALEQLAGAISEAQLGMLREIGVLDVVVNPLVARDAAIGTLTLVRTRNDAPFAAGDEAFTADLVERVALALDNARLYARAQRELAARHRLAERLSLVAEVGLDFAHVSTDLDGRLTRLASRLAHVLGEACTVWVVDPGSGRVEPRASARAGGDGGTLDTRPRWRALDPGEGLVGRVLAGRSPVFLPEVAPGELLATTPPDLRAAVAADAVHSLVIVPLVAGGEPVGALGMSRRDPSRPYTLEDLHFLGDLAARIGLALTNARLVVAAEHAAREATHREARFRALVERSADMITLTDRAGTLLYASPAARAVTGWAPEEFVGKQAQTWIHPEDRARVLAEARPGHGGRPESVFVTYRTQHRDGGTRWVESWFTNLLGEPAVRAVVGNTRDVTDRERARLALEESETRFLRLAESGILGVVVCLTDGTIVDTNETFAQLVGYPRGELVAGHVPWSALIPDGAPATEEEIAAQLRGERPRRPVEKEYLRKDGVRVPVLVGVAPLDATRTIRFVADLTDRRLAERALRSSEEQLRQAQKMEAVGRLAGGVAHDYNNVLTVILSFSDLLLHELAPEDPMRADVEEIRRAADRAAALTRQLLLFSRQQVVQPRLVDVNDLVRNLQRMLVRVVGEAVVLTTRTTAVAPRVFADPSQLEQVLVNLVVNARDAMPGGGEVLVEVSDVDLDDAYTRAHLGTQPGPHVLIAVRDVGVGMDEQTAARIFEPFFTTKPRGAGTGLGLSTVFAIVRQSRGNIWVETRPGEGTTFRIYLPRAAETAATPGVAAPRPAAGGTETILLVEDEHQVRVVARSILLRQGYRVLEASDALDAVRLCSDLDLQLDLLLSDVVMPHMSGPELARRVAAIRPSLRVLCMSGYTEDAVVRHGLVGDGIPFLPKPFTPESLARKVREVLDGR